MYREIARIAASFLLVVAAAALGLAALNAVPPAWARLTAGPPEVPAELAEKLTYDSIEAAERDLGVKVIVPSYFPSTLVWPPASIRGQKEPAPVVSLLFRSADGRQALQVRELRWTGEVLPFELPQPLVIVERTAVELEGKPGTLLVGTDQSGGSLNQLRWRDGGVHFSVTTVLPIDELVRIAGSMHVD